MTGRRERKKEQTRQALVQALVAAIDEGRRFGDVSCDEIADAANVSTRTFFRYFETKDDLALLACGIGVSAYRYALDDLTAFDIDARLLQRLVHFEPRLLGVAFERLTGGLRPRFVPAATLLDVVMDPATIGVGIGSVLAERAT